MDLNLETQIEDLTALLEGIQADRVKLEKAMSEASEEMWRAFHRLEETTENMNRQVALVAQYVQWFPWKIAGITAACFTVGILVMNVLWLWR